MKLDLRLSSLTSRAHRLPVMGASLFATVAMAAGPVHETPHELHTTADLDGDGREDLVIVDRASGVYRIGYQLAAGTFTWTDARASGVEDVSSVAPGRLLTLGRDALAFTAPAANRVNIFDASDPAVPGNPRSYFPPALGPQLLAALDIGGAGNTGHDDLFATTALNNAPSADQRTLVRSTGASLSTIVNTVSAAVQRRAGSVLLKDGNPRGLGLTVAAGALDNFQVHSLATGNLALLATASGLPKEARWVHHRFAASLLHQYLFYRAGSSNLILHPVTEPVPGTFGFGAAVNLPLGNSISLVVVLPGATGAKLLVLFNGGASAAVYNFDGVNPPTLVQQFTPSAGESFIGAAALSGNGLMFFSGAAASGVSSRFATQLFNGTSYTPGASGNLPGLTPYTAPANVFVFQQEPFVTASPKLVQSLAAGQWSSKPVLAGGPLQISVTTESFAGTAAGLDNPTVRALGPVTVPGSFGLVNQYAEPISIFSFTPPVGDEVVEVTINPPAGPQNKSILVSFTTSVAGAPVFYRLDGAGNWLAYSQPFALFKTTTVSYYAKPAAGDAKSTIRQAVYEFAEEPSDLDSDNDSVPDYVELGLDLNNNGTPDYAELGQGLNPVTGNKDSDGDGFSDLNEIALGKNPYSAASKPADHERLEDNSGFDLYVTPRPLDGTVPAKTLSAVGTTLRLFDLQGSLMRFDNTAIRGVAGVVDPSAFNTNISVDVKQRLLALGTPSHFEIATAGVDKKLGRELVGLFPVPPLPAGLAVNHPYGGGNLKAEANAWAAAAQAAQGAATRAQFVSELQWEDTLIGLLVERHIELLLQDRGLDPTNEVSLFSFRTADAGRYVPTQDQLLALERDLDAMHPGYSLMTTHTAMSNGVAAPPTAAAAQLKALAADVYRLSSASNNAAPGVYPLPVDVLREFLRTGVLHSNYLAQTSLTAPQLANAAAGVSDLLGLATPRPRDTFTLTVQANSFAGGCTMLANGPALKSLVYPDGSAYLFPESFQLLAGSQVQVTAYTDRPAGLCGGDTLEVISLQLLSVPATSTVDTDGDLLPDGFECAFFGGLGTGPNDDPDGDGINTLQELLDGTDPMDKLSKGLVVANLAPPVLDLILNGGGGVTLQFQFPAAYVGKFKFGVRSSATVEGGYSDLPITPTPVGGDTFQVHLPNPGTATRFYQVYLSLK